MLYVFCNIKEQVKIRYDKISKYVHVAVTDKNIKSLSLSTQLPNTEPNKNLVEKRLRKFPANPHLRLPPQLFVYCNIIEPQIAGDIMTPLLRIILLDSSKYINGANKMYVFSPPHYLPVMRREFDTIEIDIRTSTGQKIPFQFGTPDLVLELFTRWPRNNEVTGWYLLGGLFRSVFPLLAYYARAIRKEALNAVGRKGSRLQFEKKSRC